MFSLLPFISSLFLFASAVFAQSPSPSTSTGPWVVRIVVSEWSFFTGLVVGVVALIFALFMAFLVWRHDEGGEAWISMTDTFQSSLSIFLIPKYQKVLFWTAIFMILVSVCNIYEGWWQILICFIVGVIFASLNNLVSVAAVMRASTRVAISAKTGMSLPFQIAMYTGTVVATSTVGFGLIGVSALLLVFGQSSVSVTTSLATGRTPLYDYLIGFAFGASVLSVCSRLMSGIFSKGVEIGRRFLKTLDHTIPEEDPKNPAVMGTEVSENITDIIGFGSDIYESYVLALVACFIIGDGLRAYYFEDVAFDYQAVALPFIVLSSGCAWSMVGSLLWTTVPCIPVCAREEADVDELLWVSRFGTGVTVILHIAFIAIVDWAIVRINWEFTISVYIGIVAALLISFLTEYATSNMYRPTQMVAFASALGPSGTILAGLANSGITVLAPTLVLIVVILMTGLIAGAYGISLAAIGMLSIAPIKLAPAMMCPVIANAFHLSLYIGDDADASDRLDFLHQTSQIHAAISRGYAAAISVLTSTAVLYAYLRRVESDALDMFGHATRNFGLAGLLFGIVIVVAYAGMVTLGILQTSHKVVQVTRFQYDSIDGARGGDAELDHDHFAAEVSAATCLQTIFPTSVLFVVPWIVVYAFGPIALGSMILGAIFVGYVLNMWLSNAGSSYHFARDYVELDGNIGTGMQNSVMHQNAMQANLVGDAFKDSVGPLLNGVGKTFAILALVMAPAFRWTFQSYNFWIAVIVFCAYSLFLVAVSLYTRSKYTPIAIPEKMFHAPGRKRRQGQQGAAQAPLVAQQQQRAAAPAPTAAAAPAPAAAAAAAPAKPAK